MKKREGKRYFVKKLTKYKIGKGFLENLVESLGLYTDRIVDHIDDKTEVLNKRVYKVETEIERLSRQ